MNKKKFLIIGFIICLTITIMFIFNKNRKMEPFIGYWSGNTANGTEISFDLMSNGTGLYEYNIDDKYYIWFFDWKVKDDTVIINGESGIQMFELNEVNELECISGNIGSMDIRGKYKK